MKSASIISISLLLVTLCLLAAAPEQSSPAAEAARLNNLGVAYMNQQSFAKALKAFQDAAARDPKLTAARLNRGIAALPGEPVLAADHQHMLDDAGIDQMVR